MFHLSGVSQLQIGSIQRKILCLLSVDRRVSSLMVFVWRCVRCSEHLGERVWGVGYMHAPRHAILYKPLGLHELWCAGFCSQAPTDTEGQHGLMPLYVVS